MELRRVGGSGLEVSLAGLGCNNFGGRLDAAGSRAVIDRALDRGVTLFDTADSYGKDGSSEILLGEALGARRKQAVIATKFGWKLDDSGSREGTSRRYVMSAVEASLKRLNTDWIDLFQMHVHDPLTPIEETLRALEDLIQQGKVRYIGCSGLTVEQLESANAAAMGAGTSRFLSCQHHYNLLTRQIEADIIPCLERLKMSLIPYAPLAAGLLTGKYARDVAPTTGRITSSPKIGERYLRPGTWERIEALSGFARLQGRNLLDVALAWIAANPVVCSVICGAMSPEQVDANVDALSLHLDAGQMREIDALLSVS